MECTYWEYRDGEGHPCPENAVRGSVYCDKHKAEVAGRVARHLAAFMAREEEER